MVYIICVAAAAVLILGSSILALTEKQGEDCPGYPYECTYCRHAAECFIEIGRKNEYGKHEK